MNYLFEFFFLLNFYFSPFLSNVRTLSSQRFFQFGPGPDFSHVVDELLVESGLQSCVPYVLIKAGVQQEVEQDDVSCAIQQPDYGSAWTDGVANAVLVPILDVQTTI